MADLRYDPTSGIWVANARKRRERPMEFVPMEQLHKQVICPFCRGNEDETPQTIVAYRTDGSRLTADDDPESWTARIVPNKYPSLSQATNLKECGPYRCSYHGTCGFNRIAFQGRKRIVFCCSAIVDRYSRLP